jgi:hypothetical protein
MFRARLRFKALAQVSKEIHSQSLETRLEPASGPFQGTLGSGEQILNQQHSQSANLNQSSIKPRHYSKHIKANEQPNAAKSL